VSFGIGVDAPPSARGSEQSGSWWSIGLRAGTDAALILGVGATVVIVVAGRRRLGFPRRARMLVAVCAVAASFGWITLFILDVGSVGFEHARWRQLIIASDPGRRALISVELAAGVWWVARRMRLGSRAVRRTMTPVLIALDSGFVLLAAIGGHAGVGGSSLVGTTLRLAHYVSFCGWIGTVAVLWWSARGEPALTALWPETSRIAAYGLALTGASGLLLSARVVSTVTGLLGTSYGRAVVAKMVALLLLGAVGSVAARRVARGATPRVVPIEFGLVAVALVLAGFLSSSAPAVGARFDPLPIAVPQTVTHDAADLTITTLLQPARPGPNLVRVSVLETRRPSKGALAKVTMTLMRADGTVVASRAGVPAGSGVLEWADVNVVAPGAYRVRVQVDRPSAAVPEVTGSWNVDPTPLPRATMVLSNRRWVGIAVPVGAGWIALVVAGRWWVGRRRQGSNRYPLARTVTR
jgi:putative copper export protein